MAETKPTKALRELGIFNQHGFYAEHGPVNEQYTFDRPKPPVIEGIPMPVPYLSYRPEDRGRGSQAWAWQVHRSGKHTDPGGHWRDYGAKTFTSWHDDAKGLQGAAAGKAVLQAALAWCTERYGVTAWARDPFGGYGPADFITQRLAQLLPAQRGEVKHMTDDTTQQSAAPDADAPAAETAAEAKTRKDGSPRLDRGTASTEENTHRPAWKAYMAAQKEGDAAGMAANLEGYRAFRRAGAARRKAAREKQQPVAQPQA